MCPAEALLTEECLGGSLGLVHSCACFSKLLSGCLAQHMVCALLVPLVTLVQCTKNFCVIQFQMDMNYSLLEWCFKHEMENKCYVPEIYHKYE